MRKFLDDNSISKNADDLFGHKFIAKQIGNIIIEHNINTPINIGVFGKWGVGKSSIVEILKNEILKEEIRTEQIKLITVNVWKYQSVNSIRNIIFYQIANELNLSEKIKLLYENSTTTVSQFKYLNLLKRLFSKTYLKSNSYSLLTGVFIALICCFLAFLIHNAYPLLLTYLTTFIISLLASAAIIKVGIEYFLKALTNSTTIQAKPFESEEQFEHAVIDLFNESQFKECKKVLFIDDLDRCSSNKVLNTLETIKTFLQIENCIFIIASDNEVIKKAVQEANKDFGYTDKDGANYLEKFFQHFIFIPPFISGNLRDYTKKIIKDSKLEILNDISSDALDNIIYILAYRDVINPRKIKILINSFIFEYYTIRDKENDENHLIKKGLITDRPEVIAIIVVLKIDFPLFINDLINDTTLAYNIANSKLSQIEIPEIMAKYNAADENILLLTEFLTLVKDWVPEDITPYLFVSVESANFSSLNTNEYLKLSKLIRNGNINDLNKELIDKKENSLYDIINACGQLQSYLSNTIERRNASIIFVNLIEGHWNRTRFTIDVDFKQSVYAFKNNFDKYYEFENFFDDIFKCRDGLIKIINSYGLFEEDDLSISIINSIFRVKNKDNRIVFFFHQFLSKLNYIDLTSSKFKEKHKELYYKALQYTLSKENYILILRDLLSLDVDSQVIDEYFIFLFNIVIKLVYEEYEISINDDKEDDEETDKTELLNNESFQVIINYLNEKSPNSLKAFFHFIYIQDKTFYEEVIVRNYDLIKQNNALVQEIIENDCQFTSENVPYLTDIQLLIDRNVITQIDPGYIIKALEKSVEYLSENSDETLTDTLLNNLKDFFSQADLSIDHKKKLLERSLDSFIIFPNDNVICNFLLKYYENNIETYSKEFNKLIFLRFWKVVDEHFDFNNSFLGKYNSLVKFLLNDCHSNLSETDTTDFLTCLNNLIDIYTEGKILEFQDFIIEYLHFYSFDTLQQSVIKKFLATSSENEIIFCLQLLLLKNSKSDLSKITDKLILVANATKKNISDNKLYYTYKNKQRSSAIELLLNYTDFDFKKDVIEYLPHFELTLQYFVIESSFIKLSGLIHSQYNLSKLPFKTQQNIFAKQVAIWQYKKDKANLNMIASLITIITVIWSSNSIQKRNEISTILKTVNEKLKKSKLTSLHLKAAEKEDLKFLYFESINKYSSIKKHWNDFWSYLNYSPKKSN